MWEEIKAENLYVEARLSRALPFFLRGSVRGKVIDFVRMMVDFERNSAVIDELNWDKFHERRRELGWEDGEEDGASFFAHIAAKTCQLSSFTFEFYSPKWKDYYAFALTEERPPRVLAFQITANDQKRLQLLLKARATEMAEKESEAIVIEELLMMKAAEALRDAGGEETLREHGVDAAVFYPVAVEEGYADIFYVPMPHGTYVLARFADYETAEVHAAWRRIDPASYSEDEERVKELLRRLLEP
jgi:hypothetical protein